MKRAFHKTACAAAVSLALIILARTALVAEHTSRVTESDTDSFRGRRMAGMEKASMGALPEAKQGAFWSTK